MVFDGNVIFPLSQFISISPSPPCSIAQLQQIHYHHHVPTMQTTIQSTKKDASTENLPAHDAISGGSIVGSGDYGIDGNVVSGTSDCRCGGAVVMVMSTVVFNDN